MVSQGICGSWRDGSFSTSKAALFLHSAWGCSGCRIESDTVAADIFLPSWQTMQYDIGSLQRTLTLAYSIDFTVATVFITWMHCDDFVQVFPKDHVLSALRSVFKHNVLPFEGGTMGAINGMRPDGKKDHTSCQSDEFWTGVTYSVSAEMIQEVKQNFRTSKTSLYIDPCTLISLSNGNILLVILFRLW